MWFSNQTINAPYVKQTPSVNEKVFKKDKFWLKSFGFWKIDILRFESFANKKNKIYYITTTMYEKEKIRGRKKICPPHNLTYMFI